MPKRLKLIKSQGQARMSLTRGNALQRCAEQFGRICGKDHGKSDHGYNNPANTHRGKNHVKHQHKDHNVRDSTEQGNISTGKTAAELSGRHPQCTHPGSQDRPENNGKHSYEKRHPQTVQYQHITFLVQQVALKALGELLPKAFGKGIPANGPFHQNLRIYKINTRKIYLFFAFLSSRHIGSNRINTSRLQSRYESRIFHIGKLHLPTQRPPDTHHQFPVQSHNLVVLHKTHRFPVGSRPHPQRRLSGSRR